MYLLTKFTEFFVLDSISALNHQHCGGGDITSSVSCAGQPKWSPVSKQEICIHNIFVCVKDFPIVLQLCSVVQSCMCGSLTVRHGFCYSFLHNVH